MAHTFDLLPAACTGSSRRSSAPRRTHRLDPTRIAAETGALVLHGAALLLLLAPLSPALDTTGNTPPPDVIWLEQIKPKAVPQPPEEVEVRRRPTAQPTIARAIPDPLPIAPDPIVVPQPGDSAIDVPVVADAIPESASAAEPLEGAHLAYVAAPPPPYPPQALRAQLTGTVLLRVVVDAEGRPIEVTVERSSGHRLLDAAARRQVLAKWRFRPAQRDGRAVPAIGRVPIAFTLGR